MKRDYQPLLRSAARFAQVVTMSVAVAFSAGGNALAQDNYPTKPVKIVVPYAPGGNADLTTRFFAKELSEMLGQQFLVENRPGGATNIAAEYVARAAPDGYTLYLLQGTSHGINPGLYPKLNYDPMKDFAVLGLMASTTFFLVTSPVLPINSMSDLIAYAKANPNKLSYASPGNTSPTHLAGEMLNQRAGLGMQHVPYKGDAPAIIDLIAGRVVFLFSATALPFVKDGRLKVLAVGDSKRWPLEPSIPSMTEVGFPNFEIVSYFGIGAPARTPVAIQEKINRAMNEITKRESTRKALAERGLVALSGNRAESTAYVANEIEKWKPIIKVAGAKPD